jgi:DNA-binding CsgD family transcriptional regulator
MVPRPLSPEGVRAVIARRLGEPDAGFVEGAHAATAGNPFLLGELTRSMEDEGVEPRGEQAEEILLRHGHGLSRVVLARVATLGREPRALAEAAAAFPGGSPLRHAAALAELPLSQAGHAADALTRAGVMAGGRPLRFVHPLTRQAIYDEISPARRSELHRAAAAMLVEEGAAPDDIAGHIMLAEPAADARAVDVLHRAASRARDLGALDVAARYLHRALGEPPSAGIRDAVRLELGEVHYKLGEFEAAIETVAPMLETCADPVVRVAVVELLANAYGHGLHQRAAAEAVATAELVRHPDPTSDEHLLLEAIADYHRWADPARPCDPQVLADAVRRIRGPGRGAAAVLEGHAWNLAAEASADELLELGRRALVHDPEVDLVELYADCERPDLVHPLIERRRRAAELQGDITGLAFADRMLAEWESARDLAGAEAHARRAHDALDGTNVQLAATLIGILVRRGSYDEADGLLAGSGLHGKPSELIERIAYAGPTQALLGSRAALALARGQLDEAERLARAIRTIKPGLAPLPDMDRLSEVLLRAGKPEEAQQASAELVIAARRFGARGRLGLALAQHARTLAPAEAIKAGEEAVSKLADGHYRVRRTYALLVLGEALRRAGRLRDARPILAEARALAIKTGAEPIAARAVEEQRLAGAKPRRKAVDGIDALTASEERVARLAAKGMTNAEIAGDLVLSVRTVEMHLGRVYRKLDISGRAQLPEALAQDRG